jgi:hypothetical protein
MKIDIFSAECGTHLEIATKWNVSPGEYYSGLPLPITPCPKCDNKSRGAKVARKILESAILAMENESNNPDESEVKE